MPGHLEEFWDLFQVLSVIDTQCHASPRVLGAQETRSVLEGKADKP